MVTCGMKVFKVFTVFILLPVATIAQTNYGYGNDDEEKDRNTFSTPKFKERLCFGIEGMATFGYQTTIMAAPMIGVEVFKNLTLGVGTRYMWFRSRAWNEGYHYFGVDAIARYEIGDIIILHAEFEKLNLEYYDALAQQNRRRWIDVAMVGIGYKQMIGPRSFGYFSLLYDLVNDYRSPYQILPNLPITFRTGFVFKL